MKKVWVSLLLGFLLTLFAASNSSAETCGCMGKMGDDMPMMQGMKHHGMGMMEAGRHMWGQLMKLGLDDQQKEAVKEIKNRVMKDTIRKKADLEVAHVELQDILHKDPVDLQAAETKLKQLESLKTDIHLSHIKAMEEIKTKLTPEQRKQFKENLMEQKGRKHGGKGMRPHGGKEEMHKGAERMHNQ